MINSDSPPLLLCKRIRTNMLGFGGSVEACLAGAGNTDEVTRERTGPSSVKDD